MQPYQRLYQALNRISFIRLLLQGSRGESSEIISSRANYLHLPSHFSLQFFITLYYVTLSIIIPTREQHTYWQPPIYRASFFFSFSPPPDAADFLPFARSYHFQLFNNYIEPEGNQFRYIIRTLCSHDSFSYSLRGFENTNFTCTLDIIYH
jgi:hypothetical protein